MWPFFRKHFSGLFHLGIHVIISHVLFLVWKNSLSQLYVIGGFTAMFATILTIVDRKMLITFAVLCLTLITAAVIEKPHDQIRWIFLSGALSAGCIGYIGLLNLLGVVERLKDEKLLVEEKNHQILSVTAAAQSIFLPTQTTLETDQFSITGFYRPAEACGGDWWWYKHMSNGNLRVIIGDVVGHGPGPAMITVAVVSHLNALESKIGVNDEITQWIDAINKELNSWGDRQVKGTDYSLNLTALEFDFNQSMLKVFNTGSPPVIHQGQKGLVKYVGQGGGWLGTHAYSVSCKTIPIHRGDRFLLFSDGIYETRRNVDEEFGFGRLFRLAKSLIEVETNEALNKLVTKIDSFRGPMQQEDDYTAVMIEVKNCAVAKKVS